MIWFLGWISQTDTNKLLAAATLLLLAACLGILISFAAQRGIRRHRIRRYDALASALHRQWREIVRGEVPAERWRNDPMQRAIVQSMVIQEIGAATDKDRAGLQDFLRFNGMIAGCIHQMQRLHGWRRRRAIAALGAMRVPEAVAPLAEALEDWQLETRMAAIQALGATRLAAAAEPILEALFVGSLKLPSGPVENALVHCFLDHPNLLLPYLRRSHLAPRDILARVASELATPAMADEMLILAADGRDEVRGCAAKALAAAPLPVAIPALADLVRDDVWFVRLRATSALQELFHPRTIPALLEAIRDPNRLVRIRAAAALSAFERDRMEILRNIVDSRDRYALHSIISALELNGGVAKLIDELADPLLQDEGADRLLAAVREGISGLWSRRPANPVVESVFP
jgi:hypothetical protein